MNRNAILSAFAYLGPVIATWTVSDPAWALGAGAAIPILIIAFSIPSRNETILTHSFQALNLLLFFMLVSTFVGIIEKPGEIRWAGALGSVPLGAGASAAARTAFWIIAILRVTILTVLGCRVLMGRPAVLRNFGEIPAFLRRAQTDSAS
ncbi:MAG: hypothetical protein ACKVS6_16105 [Planctomycetota bacterium]